LKIAEFDRKAYLKADSDFQKRVEIYSPAFAIFETGYYGLRHANKGPELRLIEAEQFSQSLYLIGNTALNVRIEISFSIIIVQKLPKFIQV
jgi:hypothetical protein